MLVYMWDFLEFFFLLLDPVISTEAYVACPFLQQTCINYRSLSKKATKNRKNISQMAGLYLMIHLVNGGTLSVHFSIGPPMHH